MRRMIQQMADDATARMKAEKADHDAVMSEVRSAFVTAADAIEAGGSGREELARAVREVLVRQPQLCEGCSQELIVWADTLCRISELAP